jgi:glyoxylase-like metal-dependent hydrolase (beta-lactamase superfamily II)
MKKLTLGTIEIMSLTDTELDLPLKALFPQIRAEQWFSYHQASPTSSLRGDESIHSRIGVFLVRSPEYVLLVDTGLGLGATPPPPSSSPGVPPSGFMQFFYNLPVKLLEELHACGIQPDDVDMVFLTHAHFDHYGWNLTAEGLPLFPHARYLLSRADWDAFRDPAMPTPVREGLERFVLPLSTQGVLDLVSGEPSLFKEIQVLSTPGHTPGHMSLLVNGGSQQVLIGGDTFVHPLQIFDATVSFSADMDRAQATATRQRLREWIAQENVILASNHIAGSGFGRILRDTHQYLGQEEA